MLEPGLDLSMYSEAGNIIASKFATKLADQYQIDVVLSPPARLQQSQLEYLIGASTEVAQKTYVHAHAGKDIQLQALILIHAPQTSVHRNGSGSQT
jgi:chemotaxis protein CheY-P-specific phosphatase CheC